MDVLFAAVLEWLHVVLVSKHEKWQCRVDVDAYRAVVEVLEENGKDWNALITLAQLNLAPAARRTVPSEQ